MRLTAWAEKWNVPRYGGRKPASTPSPIMKSSSPTNPHASDLGMPMRSIHETRAGASRPRSERSSSSSEKPISATALVRNITAVPRCTGVQRKDGRRDLQPRKKNTMHGHEMSNEMRQEVRGVQDAGLISAIGLSGGRSRSAKTIGLHLHFVSSGPDTRGRFHIRLRLHGCLLYVGSSP